MQYASKILIVTFAAWADTTTIIITDMGITTIIMEVVTSRLPFGST